MSLESYCDYYCSPEYVQRIYKNTKELFEEEFHVRITPIEASALRDIVRRTLNSLVESVAAGTESPFSSFEEEALETFLQEYYDIPVGTWKEREAVSHWGSQKLAPKGKTETVPYLKFDTEEDKEIVREYIRRKQAQKHFKEFPLSPADLKEMEAYAQKKDVASARILRKEAKRKIEFEKQKKQKAVEEVLQPLPQDFLSQKAS